MSETLLTPNQRWAISNRLDLLDAELSHIIEHDLSWSARLAEAVEMDMGRGGGSAADRRLVIEGMAAICSPVR